MLKEALKISRILPQDFTAGHSTTLNFHHLGYLLVYLLSVLKICIWQNDILV